MTNKYYLTWTAGLTDHVSIPVSRLQDSPWKRPFNHPRRRVWPPHLPVPPVGVAVTLCVCVCVTWSWRCFCCAEPSAPTRCTVTATCAGCLSGSRLASRNPVTNQLSTHLWCSAQIWPGVALLLQASLAVPDLQTWPTGCCSPRRSTGSSVKVRCYLFCENLLKST